MQNIITNRIGIEEKLLREIVVVLLVSEFLYIVIICTAIVFKG